jgi:hypothetical protein
LSPEEGTVFRKLLDYAWGTIARPRTTLNDLVLLLGWLNLALFQICGYDWLGTRRELLDPTYVGLFGQLRVGTERYVPIFGWVISPLLAVLSLVVMPGLAHVLSKLWRGQGTFEQMINALAYAQVPSILIRSVFNDMLLGGVPANLIAGHPYAFTAAMSGEFGPTVMTLWWIYMIGIYIVGVDLWIVVLGATAIHRIQRIPWWAAILIMLFAYVLWFYGLAGSVVR